ncbi:MAG: DNA polymerase III subunit gamma/tau, partial [Solirubrobacterales bacterium]
GLDWPTRAARVLPAPHIHASCSRPLMAETSLYRRHRPQSFDEVVGQEAVVRTLSNAVQRDRVHHAYLFVGSRGTGKTSVAKILARSLNCVNGPTLQPCGECESCTTIAAGSSLDVIEMDAASNRSVDDIRELRERVGYVAASGRSKVYILDEAHMLTREAWNAFLKTLEEPPPNTVFVLATTEPHKVMPTIVDRCQRFDFGRPSAEQIAGVIRRVAELERVSIEDEAVAAIARSAQGSFRDALGTLDQLVAYGVDEIATEDTLAVLGIADAELIFAAAEAIAAQDGRAAIETEDALVKSGRDPVRFARDVIEHLRQVLVVSTSGEVPESFALGAARTQLLREQAGRLDEVALVRAIDALSAALSAIREGDEARMSLELALLRSARPQIDPSRDALAQRLERLESQAAGKPALAAADPAGEISVARDADGGEPAGGEVSSASEAPPEASAEDPPGGRVRERETRESSPSSMPADTTEATAATAVAPAPEPVARPSAGVEVEQIAALWPAIVEQLRESGSELLSTVIEAARPIGVDAERSMLEIGFPASAAFNKRKAEMKANCELFADAVRAVTGISVRPAYVLLDEEADGGSSNGTPERLSEQEEEELVQRLKAEFDAEEFDPEAAEADDSANPQSEEKEAE